MKIVLLSGWYFPDSVGGTEVYVEMLAHDLQNLGHEVMVAAPIEGNKESQYIYNNVQVFRYPVTPTPSRAEVRGEAVPEYFGCFSEWLESQKPDIVHQHSYNRSCGLFHAEFVKSQSIPLIFTAHVPGVVCSRGTLMRWGTEPCDGHFINRRCTACMLHQRGLHKLPSIAIASIPQLVVSPVNDIQSSFATPFQMKRLVNDSYLRMQEFFSICDRVVSVAAWLADILLSHGVQKEKILVSRHGLSISSAFTTNRTSYNRYPLRVGYIGRFSNIKGVHILIEAFGKLSADERKKIHLYIYGMAQGQESEKYLAFLKRQAQGIENINFAGEVTDVNRHEIMNNLDLLAVPSLWFETGPLVVLEAFSANIPVIGSAFGGISENVVHNVNGLLVEPGNINAWKDTFKKIVDEPSLLQELQLGIGEVRRSSDVTLEMVDIYSKAIMKRRDTIQNV